MNKIDKKFAKIRSFCEKNGDPAIIKKYSRYFNEGYDAYGLSQEIYDAQRKKWLSDWKEEMTIDDYIKLGDKLISTGKYEEGSYAISLNLANKKHFTPEMFEKYGSWLDSNISNWAHTDVHCGKVLGHFIQKDMVSADALKGWVKSISIWKRRAVPVTLLEALKHNTPLKRIFKLIDPLMLDEAKKVQQGLGWLLRECWKKYPLETEEFLMKWKDNCGRTIIQYATEKMSKEYRLKFRREKKVIQ